MSSGKGQARPAPSARFSVSRTVEAIDALLTEEIRYYCRFALLIVDEIGYRPVTPGGGNLFFELVNARYEKGAMILTSNRGFGEWGDIFGNSVVATAPPDKIASPRRRHPDRRIELSVARARRSSARKRPLQTKCRHQSHSTDPEASRPAAKEWRRRSHTRLIANPRQLGFSGAHFGENRGAIDKLPSNLLTYALATGCVSRIRATVQHRWVRFKTLPVRPDPSRYRDDCNSGLD